MLLSVTVSIVFVAAAGGGVSCPFWLDFGLPWEEGDESSSPSSSPPASPSSSSLEKVSELDLARMRCLRSSSAPTFTQTDTQMGVGEERVNKGSLLREGMCYPPSHRQTHIWVRVGEERVSKER